MVSLIFQGSLMQLANNIKLSIQYCISWLLCGSLEQCNWFLEIVFRGVWVAQLVK